MVPFAGWEMPVQYDSIVGEHHRVRTAAGLFDVSHMGEIEIAGPEAEACCARLFTNDATRLAPGRAQYSLLANEHGGLLDDVIVYKLEPERFLVCVNAANRSKDLAWIEAYACDGCTIRDLSDGLALIALQGPKAVEVAATLAPETGALRRFGVAEVSLGGVEVLAARTGYTGEDGLEFFVPTGDAVDTWRALLAAGEPHGIGPIGLGARDTLRLEAALPLYGHELGEDISPFEARVGWAVKLNRPQMVGYQALENASQAEPERRLIGLEMDGGIARAGHPVMSVGDGSGRVGEVTSGSHSPTLGKGIALALVENSAGGELAVEIRGKCRPAHVTNLPFYVRQADER